VTFSYTGDLHNYCTEYMKYKSPSLHQN